MNYREICTEDIRELFYIRTHTDENNLSLEELHSLGITVETIREKLNTTYTGWLCEHDNKIIGFAIGDKKTGEIWVIAVFPEYINQGIGSKLLLLVEKQLWKSGCKELWLETDINPKLRAYSFYKKNGWIDDRIENESRYMKKIKS